jgi:hypothetical protein
MDPRRFYRLTKTLSTPGSRRRVLEALLAGVLANARLRTGSAPWRGGVSRLILGVSRRC